MLLEVIVAVTILATAGVSAAIMAGQAADAVRHAREADAGLRRASAFLHAVALWPREDLDRRLGERPQGAWRLRIQRPVPTLYLVMLVDSARGTELLRTSLFRPESPRVAP